MGFCYDASKEAALRSCNSTVDVLQRGGLHRPECISCQWNHLW